MQVEVVHDKIVCTDETSGWTVAYTKPQWSSGLIAQEERTAPGVSVRERAEFLAVAWQTAVGQARKLGWIV